MHIFKNENDETLTLYLDESWISQNHSSNFICHHSTIGGGLKVPIGKEEIIFMLHGDPRRRGFGIGVS